MFGLLLEAELIKQCTRLWCEAHVQAKMSKKCCGLQLRNTLGSSADQKMHAAVARSTCWSENAKKKRSEVRTFFCVASPMGSAPSHMWEKHEGLWQLQKKMAGVGRLKKTCTTPHCTSLHYTRLPCTTPHFNYNYKRNWNNNYATTMQLQVQAQRQLQPQLLHYNCICNYNYCCATLHEASATLRCTSLDYIALQPQLKLRVQLNYNYGFKRNFNYNYTTLRYR